VLGRWQEDRRGTLMNRVIVAAAFDAHAMSPTVVDEVRVNPQGLGGGLKARRNLSLVGAVHCQAFRGVPEGPRVGRLVRTCLPLGKVRGAGNVLTPACKQGKEGLSLLRSADNNLQGSSIIADRSVPQ
jgi:hypothetical protein